MSELTFLRHTMPCGCQRGIVKRMAPDINEDGTPKLDNGAFVMKEIEELQESYCSEHTKVLVERQQEVQKALASGASADEAIALLMGATPFSALTDGKKYLNADEIVVLSVPIDNNRVFFADEAGEITEAPLDDLTKQRRGK